MYGSVVLGVDHHRFEEIIEHAKLDTGVTEDTQLTAAGLAPRRRRATRTWSQSETGKPFPQDPEEQLWGAIGAVFGSWMNPRAITYRRLHDIPAEWGTAVNVQAMVFGNMGDDCATGVCFTRDPSTGENVFYGEYLVNAQGEDVVAGIRTPQPLSKAVAKPDEIPLEAAMPEAYARAACRCAQTLEQHYKRHAGPRVHRPAAQAVHAADPQRQAHRRGVAAHRGGHGARGPDRRGRGGACGSNPSSLDQLLHPMLDPKAPRTLLAKGLPASPGAASRRRWCSPPTRRRAARRRARR